MQVLHPFYLFQLCSVVLWFLDDYYVYSTCIFFISAISIVVSLYETKKQSVTLANMVKSADTSVTVIRSDGGECARSALRHTFSFQSITQREVML